MTSCIPALLLLVAFAQNSQTTEAQRHLAIANALRAEAETAGKLRQPFLARKMKAEYELAEQLDPTLVEPHHWLVMFHIYAPRMFGGDVAKAKQEVATLMTLEPMRGHLDAAAVAEKENDVVAADRELLAAIAAAPANPLPYRATGAFYRRQKRTADAVAMYQKALTLNPADEAAKKALASLK